MPGPWEKYGGQQTAPTTAPPAGPPATIPGRPKPPAIPSGYERGPGGLQPMVGGPEDPNNPKNRKTTYRVMTPDEIRGYPNLDPNTAYQISSEGNISVLQKPDDKQGGDQLKPEQRTAVANEALQKLKLIRSLDQRSRDGWFATGFGSGVASGINGTTAADVSKDVQTVAAAGALQRIMEMAATNGGKNPLTPLSNADFQALGQSIANLDPTQSDEQFQRNLKVYADIYRRALLATGVDPSALDQETKDYLANLPQGAPMTGQAMGKGSFQYKGQTITFDIPEGATDAQIGEAAAKAAREAGSKVPASQFDVNRQAAPTGQPASDIDAILRKHGVVQ